VAVCVVSHNYINKLNDKNIYKRALDSHSIMADEKQQIKPFLRVLNTDLIGEKAISRALLKVKGIGFNMSTIICNILGIPKDKKSGLLTQEETKKIETLLKEKKDLPEWVCNRRKDPETGETKYLTGADLNFINDLDIKKLKKIKSYRGLRHALGGPTRGQRTRSHFRKSGKAIGVIKSKIAKGGGKKG
jgi:small subunit ribosomal protein S13